MKDNQPCKDAITGQVCFDRGECKCGQCYCGEDYEGQFASEKRPAVFARRWETYDFEISFQINQLSVQNQLEPCVKGFALNPETMENIGERK